MKLIKQCFLVVIIIMGISLFEASAQNDSNQTQSTSDSQKGDQTQNTDKRNEQTDELDPTIRPFPVEWILKTLGLEA